MNRRLLLVAGAVVVLVTLAGGWALLSMPASGADYNLEYKLITDCEGDRAMDANETRDCGATLFVRNMSESVAYAEVRAVDGAFGETTVSTVTGSDDMAIVENLSYFDTVIVTVQPKDGHKEVLERHEITCEDVRHTDACGNETEDTDS